MTKPTLSHLPAIPVLASAFSLKGSRCRQEHRVGTLKSWVQVLKSWWISTFTIWGLGPKETQNAGWVTILSQYTIWKYQYRMYFPPKNYFKNITASPDFYPNDPKSFSAKRQTQLTELFLNQFPVISMPPGTGSPRRCQNIWSIS